MPVVLVLSKLRPWSSRHVTLSTWHDKRYTWIPATPSRDVDDLGYLVLNTSPITMQDNQSLTLQSIVPAFIKHVFDLFTHGGACSFLHFTALFSLFASCIGKTKIMRKTTFLLTTPAIHRILTNTSCPSSGILAQALFFLFAFDNARLKIWRRQKRV